MGIFQIVLNEVRRAQQTSLAASNEAQAAYDFANDAKELSMRELETVTGLTSKITDFTSKDSPTPQDVQQVAEQVISIFYLYKCTNRTRRKLKSTPFTGQGLIWLLFL